MIIPPAVELTRTTAIVKKKFQWTPYSVTCSWYSTDFTTASLTTPSSSSGSTCLPVTHSSRQYPAMEEGGSEGRRASRDVMPCDITKRPTPTSMSPLPYVSVFTNLRGKMGKSTARIAMAVTSTMKDLVAVMNGKALYGYGTPDDPLLGKVGKVGWVSVGWWGTAECWVSACCCVFVG